jgi:hypothetical protein
MPDKICSSSSASDAAIQQAEAEGQHASKVTHSTDISGTIRA